MFWEFLGMNTRLEGKVTRYGKKRYGFVEVPGRMRPIRIRFVDGRMFFQRDDAIEWSDDARIMREPQLGDPIVLELSDKKGAPMASRWGYASELAELVDRLKGHLAA